MTSQKWVKLTKKGQICSHHDPNSKICQNLGHKHSFRMHMRLLELKFPLELMKPEIIFRPFMFRVKLKLTGNSVQIVLY